MFNSKVYSTSASWKLWYSLFIVSWSVWLMLCGAMNWKYISFLLWANWSPQKPHVQVLSLFCWQLLLSAVPGKSGKWNNNAGCGGRLRHSSANSTIYEAVSREHIYVSMSQQVDRSWLVLITASSKKQKVTGSLSLVPSVIHDSQSHETHILYNTGFYLAMQTSEYFEQRDFRNLLV